MSFPNPSLPWQTALAIFVASIVGSIFALFIVYFLLRPLVGETTNKIDDDLLQFLRWPSLALLPTIAALITMTLFIPYLELSTYTLIHQILVALLLAIITWFTFNLARTVTAYFLRRIERQLLPLPDQRPYERARTRLIVISRAVYVILFLLGICAIVFSLPGGGSYGISLLASAGIASLVMGIAATPVLQVCPDYYHLR